MESRLLLLFILLLLSIFQEVDFVDSKIAKPGCKDTCGNVSIPYPFGIGPNHNCFHNKWFEIECNTSRTSNGSASTKPVLSKLGIEVMKVWLNEDRYYSGLSFEVRIPPINACHVEARQQLSGIDLRGSPFHFSREFNAFVMKGCPGHAVLVNQSNAILAGCATVCGNNNSNNNNTALEMNSCNGDDCCQTSIGFSFKYPTKFYKVDFSHLASLREGRNCLVATLIDYEYLANGYYVGDSSSIDDQPFGVPVVLRWNFGTELPRYTSPHATCDHVSFYDEYGIFSYCNCKEGYYGNPYISDGCQVTRECMDCRGHCHGEWDINGLLVSPSYHCEKKPILNRAAISGLSISLGIVVMVIGLYGLYRVVKWRREIKQRVKFFKRNGGLLLQQQLSTNDGVMERTRIFSINELEKATDHFNENRILGQGGQGTVYKGMLADGRIVAIKKSKLLDKSQLEQFINEVVILSQINHRNVVRLLGCCLETDIPLLVYEFVSNGTLHQHIHDPDEDFVITWEMCLKIASDSAAAIAYLHSSSSIPIYHRDIKSSNILLDEKHKAKVSDFGSSRAGTIDQTHMTTLVRGTMGYLDPEYFQSNQFTEKSDVYSFGVVLLEFLTRKKPIFKDESTMEQKNLVSEFLFLSQSSRLSDILDPEITREAKEEELISFVELTKRCISWSGKLRPTMKEVAMVLEMIIKSPNQVSRWFQEQEAPPNEELGFEEYAITDLSGSELMSNTYPDSASNPPQRDVHPLLHDSN